jgi:hypothetical protein
MTHLSRRFAELEKIPEILSVLSNILPQKPGIVNRQD